MARANSPAAGLPLSLPLLSLIVFAAIFVVGAVGFEVPRYGALVALPLLPSGLAVGVMHRWGYRLWPTAFAGVIAIDLSHGRPLLAALGSGIGVAAAAALTVWLLNRRHFDRTFSRALDAPELLIAAALGMTVAAAFSTAGYLLSGLPGSAWSDWLRCWGDTTGGVVLAAPILIGASRQSFARILTHRLEATLWLLGVVLCCAAIIVVPGPIGRPLILLLAVLLVVTGAMRFGLVVAASAVLAILATMMFSFGFGRGSFADLTEERGLVTLWSWSATLIGLALTITALLAQRDAAALELLRAERRYVQIFEANPQPLWVHDFDTGEFLLVNAAALRQYGWSREEFLANRVSMLAPGGAARVLQSDVYAEAGGEPNREPLETRHRTRDGRVIEVEVWARAFDLDGRRAVLVFANDVSERRALGMALVDAVTGEQQRIGQEIHDGLGQELTGLALSARALATRVGRERLTIAGDLEQLAALASGSIRSARAIVQGLAPLRDADGSLEAALTELAERSAMSGISVRFHSDLEEPLTLDIESRNHLYRIAQEAVHNALKHAGATIVEVHLRAAGDTVRLSVGDDGRGPQGAARDSGLGMRTMRFRASAIGGRLTVAAAPAGGTIVSCELARSPELRASG